MDFETLLYERDGPLAWITLNRPEKLNAINAVMVDELNRAVHRAETNIEPTDDFHMTEMRKERMALKDEIWGILTAAA